MKIAHCSLFLFLLPFLAFAEAPRHALVIGNSAYRHVEILPNTANDASDVAQKLAVLGYTVDLHLNADLAGMTRALSAWIRQLSADRSSEGFLWYAGHGMQIAGENYLLPVDIEAEDEAALIYGSYPLGRLLLSLEQTARNKLNVVVLDACRDNPFRNVPGGTRGLSRGFVTVEHPPQDIFIMFSTSPGTVAADGEGSRNSPFTEAFLRYMDSGEILPVMAGLVTRETMRLTNGRQRPYQNGSIVSELYYSLGGVRPSGSDTPPAAAPIVAASPSAQVPERTVAVPSPVMLPVSAGTFSMGSNGMELDRAPFGETLRLVELDAFYLAAKTVSVGEFRRFVEDSGHVTTAEADGGALAYNETSAKWEFRAGANWR
ncbi:MAG: caspase family protein, partial [Treponema sp.]|nr:caspase family protein [Treponema sp.]